MENDVRLVTLPGEQTNVIPTLTLYQEAKFAPTSKFGFSAYAWVSKDGPWAEYLPGIYWRPSDDKFVLAGYFGVETSAPHYRVGAYVAYMPVSWFTTSFWGEKGAGDNNFYYDFQEQLTLVSRDHFDFVTIARWRRGYGLGMPIGVKWKAPFGADNFKMHTFIAPFYDFEAKQAKYAFFLNLEF